MAKRNKAEGPIRPKVGEEWPNGLEVREEGGRKEQPSEHHRFVVNEVFRLATCVILILLGYSLAKSETTTLSHFGDRAWWIVIGVLLGTMLRRPALTRIMELWNRIEKRK